MGKEEIDYPKRRLPAAGRRRERGIERDIRGIQNQEYLKRLLEREKRVLKELERKSHLTGTPEYQQLIDLEGVLHTAVEDFAAVASLDERKKADRRDKGRILAFCKKTVRTCGDVSEWYGQASDITERVTQGLGPETIEGSPEWRRLLRVKGALDTVSERFGMVSDVLEIGEPLLTPGGGGVLGRLVRVVGNATRVGFKTLATGAKIGLIGAGTVAVAGKTIDTLSPNALDDIRSLGSFSPIRISVTNENCGISELDRTYWQLIAEELQGVGFNNIPSLPNPGETREFHIPPIFSSRARISDDGTAVELTHFTGLREEFSLGDTQDVQIGVDGGPLISGDTIKFSPGSQHNIKITCR